MLCLNLSEVMKLSLNPLMPDFSKTHLFTFSRFYIENKHMENIDLILAFEICDIWLLL